MSRPEIPVSPLIAEDEAFVRMSAPERWQHILVVATFVLLILTGLPVLLNGVKVFTWVFSARQSFYIRGLIHRAAALILIGTALWHAGWVLLTANGRRYFRDMLPRAKDLRDAVQTLAYGFGLASFLGRKGIGKKFFARHPFWLGQDPPQFGRYSYVEKFEYWALIWGTGIMIVSGFFMWRVNLSLRLFPLWVHNIFIVVHSFEAVLALLAILTWHMYNVHLNPADFPMSRVWLNGKITGRELRLEHPLEYAEISRARRLEGKKRAAACRRPRARRMPGKK